MGNPIVIDDGGSTRVKRIDPSPSAGPPNPPPSGVMDDLLAVRPGIGLPAPIGSPGSKHTENGVYSQLMIVYQDSQGDAYTVPAQPFNNFEITSGLSQSVKGELVVPGPGGGGPPGLRFSIFGAGGVEPLIEARQRSNQRRYVIANAGSISTVEVNGAVVFDATGPLPAGGSAPAIYTSVVLR